jgi:CheY-like chemotaxis protein
VLEPGKEIRVLLVEDDNLVRLGLKLVLNAMTGIKVVGEAQDGLSAIEQSREFQPDLVLLDIWLSKRSYLVRNGSTNRRFIRVLCCSLIRKCHSIYACYTSNDLNSAELPVLSGAWNNNRPPTLVLHKVN